MVTMARQNVPRYWPPLLLADGVAPISRDSSPAFKHCEADKEAGRNGVEHKRSLRRIRPFSARALSARLSLRTPPMRSGLDAELPHVVAFQ